MLNSKICTVFRDMQLKPDFVPNSIKTSSFDTNKTGFLSGGFFCQKRVLIFKVIHQSLKYICNGLAGMFVAKVSWKLIE